jgi:hypothetical protein
MLRARWRSTHSSLSGGGDQSLEQGAEFAGLAEVLGVPLHADAEARAGILNAFDHAIRGGGRGDQSCAEARDSLVVSAVHAAQLRGTDSRAESAFQAGSACHRNVVRRRILRGAHRVLDPASEH